MRPTAPLPRAEGTERTKVPSIRMIDGLLPGPPILIDAVGDRHLEKGDGRRERGHREKDEKSRAEESPAGKRREQLRQHLKMSPGPSSMGSKPSIEKPVGKMMNPASSAIAVSTSTTHSADTPRLSRRLM